VKRRVLELGLVAPLVLVSLTEADTQAVGSVILPSGTISPCYVSQGAHRVVVAGERLEAAYDLLLDRSPTFAAAIQAIEAGGSMRVRIGYRQHVMRPFERLVNEERSGAAFLTEGLLFQPPGTILCEVRVVFFTEELEAELLRQGVPEEELVMDLALVLAHEVYGHLVPFTDQPAPAWPSPCRDPAPRHARTRTGCAVDRENVIREELGVRERTSYARVDGPLLCSLPGQACTSHDRARAVPGQPVLLGRALAEGAGGPLPAIRLPALPRLRPLDVARPAGQP
jgi:hypothetical protein